MKYDLAITLVSSILSVVVLWWVFYLLWNSIAAGIFNLPELSFPQTVLLFGAAILAGEALADVIRRVNK